MQSIISPRIDSLVQYVLFTILVVLTPFIVVTRYLQGVAHIFSHLSFTIFGFEAPYLVLLALLVLAAMLVWQRKYITRRSAIAVLFIAGLIFISHQTMDIYLDMSFFDLQQNWHYLAYGAYVFFFFRAFHGRIKSLNKIMLAAYFSAVGMSVFDETFQYFLSDRVFDISDIAKDGLGVYCGLIIILFITGTYGKPDFRKSNLIPRKVRGYFIEPLPILLMLGALTISFILFSPLLTEHENWDICLICCLGVFLTVMVIIHLLQYKFLRRAFIVTAAVLILLLFVSYAANQDKNITHNSFGLTAYKGIPAPFFDLIIYPNGFFHFVDKKHYFRTRDKEYILKHEPDILLIGSGTYGKGGKGFDQGVGTHFIFNKYSLKGTQVIIMPTQEACKKFNELKAAGKSVLFVLHNTC